MAEMENIGARLRTVREDLNLSQRELARTLGIGPNAWQIWESGKNVPTGENLLKIADLGFNPGWILTGIGPKRLEDSGTVPGFSNAPSNAIDPVLFGRITDAIAAVYKEMNARISPRDLGVLGAEKYSEIAASSSDPEEWPGMVKLMTTMLRKELSNPVTDTDNRKASA